MAIVTKLIGGIQTVPDLEFKVIFEALEEIDEMSKRKLIEEVLPAKLVDYTLLTNDERKIMEKIQGLDFTKPMFVINGMEVKNINFLKIAAGEKPVVVLTFTFFGVQRSMDIETLSIRELFEVNLWEKLDAFKKYDDNLFKIPDCVFDSDCNRDYSEQYCKDMCDSTSSSWYGVCPVISATCKANDNACVACFYAQECVLWSCKANPWGRGEKGGG